MAHQIDIRVEEPICVVRRKYPITQGCPFPQGALHDSRQVRLLIQDGAELPLQTQTLATWPDGSIKWLLMDTRLDLRPRQIVDLCLEYGPDIAASPVNTLLQVRSDVDGLSVDTGALALRLNRRGPALVATAGAAIRDDGTPQMTVRDEQGTVYTGQVEHLEVEEQNALRAVVKATGGFVADDGRRGLSWIIRFYVYADQPFVKLYHTFFHDQDNPIFFRLQEMVLRLPLVIESDPHVMTGTPPWGVSHGDDWGVRSEQVAFSEMTYGKHTIFGVSEDRIEHGYTSHGWVYAGDANSGVQLKLRHPAQNYPKRYTADGNSLEVHLYPDPTGWTPATKKGLKYTELHQTTDGEFEGALQVPQGMAKTHELFLYAGPAAVDLVAAAEWAAAFEYPLLLEIDSCAYADSGALGTFPRHYPEYWRMEASLTDVGSGMTGGGLVGMINYGDTGITTVENGKQKTLTTDNLAYDHIRGPLRQFLRRGDQSFFWQAEAMALHLMDVDTIRHSTQFPERIGGPSVIWSQYHHYTDTSRTELVIPRTAHVWVGGLLDFYYLTGYRRALETLELTGTFCAGTRKRVGWDNMPPTFRDDWENPRLDMTVDGYPDWYSIRRAGWALTGMTDLYEAKPGPALAEEIRGMIRVLERWQDADGRWRSRFGAFMRSAEVFMHAAALNGLFRAYELLGDETAKELCVKGCRFIATTTITKDGLMYYKESPVNNSTPINSNLLAIRPMVFAYRQTGEAAILKAMWRMFRWSMDRNEVKSCLVHNALWALPLFHEAGLLQVWKNEEIEEA